ncbi:MAG TPA: hypothetical protein P5556_02740 [Candidatus Gastranaerophilales bacterium]|nr:hypothetical protein [Candidatus Gastranaerophilales bacterium]
MKRLLILTLLLTSTACFAKNGYYNSYNNGNTYSSYGSSVRGNNYNTGSSWNTNYNSSGSSGRDSNGNYWNYNKSAGNYYNYGTGEMRHRGKKY